MKLNSFFSINKFLLLSSFTLLLVFKTYSQTIALQYIQTGNTNNSFIFDVMVSKTSAEPLKLAALNTVLFYPSGTLSPGTVTFQMGPLFSGFTPPTAAQLGYITTQLKIRQQISPVGEATAVSLTSTPIKWGTMTVTSANLITYPLSLMPSGTGNPTIQATVYHNGATNSSTITFAAGQITVTPNPFILQTGLPVQISSIKAFENGKNNMIKWTTANEANCAFHIVEKSQDGKFKWEELGRVKAQSLFKESEYELADRNPAKLTYYRIRFQDFDGNNSFSNIVSVDRQDEQNSPFLKIHPNPTNDIINLDLTIFDKNDGPIEITVYDLNGKQVLNKVTSDTGSETIDIRTLPANTYNIKVKQGELIFSEKVIKVD